ncbi:hypothetical protein [Mitsuokella jalaludinii]|uniref:hypothetical protein n=1 Tax=Mitsuokella jalaludinii TaxID=187979 RepID=UPI003077A3D3
MSTSRVVPSAIWTPASPLAEAVATDALALPRRATERLPVSAVTAGRVVACRLAV